MSIFSAACQPGPLRPLSPQLQVELAGAAAGFGGWTRSYPASALGGTVGDADRRRRSGDSGAWLIAGRRGRSRGIVIGCRGHRPAWMRSLPRGRNDVRSGLAVALLPGDHAVLAALRAAVPWLSPVPIGRRPSIGLGDRTGYATRSQAIALGRSRLFPVFAQQSVREMTRTDRTPEQVLDDATFGVLAAGWRGGWSADADHLKDVADIDRMAKAGFVLFTLDASPALRPGAERSADPAVRFGPAVPFLAALARRVHRAMRGRPYELEVSLDELPVVTTPADHEYVVRELARRGIRVAAVAPRFPGSFEKGVDFRGSLPAFARALAAHAAVARRLGGYKISIHSGSDKFRVYRTVARITRGRFHVKTAGTSWLESLRTIARVDPGLFREIVDHARRAFPVARRSYSISARLRDVPAPRGIPARRLESVYLDRPAARQVLHVAFGAILGARSKDGWIFRDRVHRLLALHEDTHESVLVRHLGRHIRLLRP
ncbi:MAG: tagaturonate epimerase family protein [Candidatus Coatesbacteria bacterium]